MWKGFQDNGHQAMKNSGPQQKGNERSPFTAQLSVWKAHSSGPQQRSQVESSNSWGQGTGMHRQTPGGDRVAQRCAGRHPRQAKQHSKGLNRSNPRVHREPGTVTPPPSHSGKLPNSQGTGQSTQETFASGWGKISPSLNIPLAPPSKLKRKTHQNQTVSK